MRTLALSLTIAIAPVVLATSVLLTQSQPAFAAKVSNIQVRGNTRMDDETIKSFLTIEVGQNFSNNDIDDSVRALFGTGLFEDVGISKSGSTLIVEVSENSTINQVFFEGNKRIKDGPLSATIQSKSLEVYSEDIVASDVDRIQQAYDRVGRGDAIITSEVVPLSNNRVNIVFSVNEGDKTKIRSISFIGNDAFREMRLREVMGTKRSNLFSFIKSDDVYDPDRLAADEERLRRFYFNHGYADFDIVSTSAVLDEANNEYNITITVEEGALYKFGEIGIESTLNGVDVDSLYSELETRTGKKYSANDVEDSIVALTERIAGDGYAFVEVVPRGDRDFDSNTIDVTYLIDQGSRVFIDKIVIVGNSRTREHVIRREFDISEGDALNQVLLQRTRKRLEALGYFESVDITTRPADTADKVVVVVRVADKPTGEFSLGGGYSNTAGATAEISFTERNFLGRGQYIKVSGSGGSDSRNYNLSFTEPYFLGYRMSAGFDVGRSTTDAVATQEYSTENTFGTLRFGVPISEKLKASLFYTYSSSITGIDSGKLDTVGTQGDSSGELSNALVPRDGSNKEDWTKSGFGYSLTYNTIDSRTTPREGEYLNLSQTAFGAGGDASYLTTTANVTSYTTLSEDFDLVGMLRARGGINTAFDDDGYRALDNFRQGGKAIRGFANNGFGPRDSITGDALGGMYYWNATAEVNFPAPLLPESMGIRAALFADAGVLGGTDDISKQKISDAGSSIFANGDAMRASYGASIIWNSPFGPLRFNYAEPVESQSYDKIRNFSFGISSSF
ncbi:MAG: outer membrane protein assembly factor BamA [Nitratireductor sp.]